MPLRSRADFSQLSFNLSAYSRQWLSREKFDKRRDIWGSMQIPLKRASDSGETSHPNAKSKPSN